MKQLLSIFFVLSICINAFAAEERVLQFRNGAALVSGTNFFVADQWHTQMVNNQIGSIFYTTNDFSTSIFVNLHFDESLKKHYGNAWGLTEGPPKNSYDKNQLVLKASTSIVKVKKY